MSARLALVGAPGSGKTAVAQELGRRWRCSVRDTDADYADRHGHSVGEAVIADESAFRELEAALSLDALAQDGAVVALGSGAPSAEVAAALAAVPVVWLEVGLAQAARRTGLSGMRPVALGNVRGQFHEMLQERAALYASLADVTVNTDDATVGQIADRIEEWETSR